MRIALVIERMDTSRGGRETSTAQTACALAARGHEVEILCQRGSWQGEGVIVTPLGGGGLLPSRRLESFVSAIQETDRRRAYDVLHATLPVPGANVYQPRGGTAPGRQAARIRRNRLVGRVSVGVNRVFNRRRRVTAEMERRIMSDRSVTCLAVSEMIAREIAQYYARNERVRVIFNAVDVPDPAGEQRAHERQRIRYMLGVSPRDPVFLTVAKNFELKGVAEAIAAFAKWHHGHAGRIDGRLVVVGRENPEGYQRYAGLREVGRRVVFVPPVEDIFSWYAAADACILLSWYDPCSRVVLEAVRWGIPSLTTAYNGASEILAGGAGIVVDSPRDTEAVVRALDELADPQARARRSEACVRVADGLGLERHVDELLEVYREVARRT